MTTYSGHDGKGGRGGMGERSEEADDGAGEGAEHEGGAAERPDTGAGLGVGHASSPLARLSLRRGRAFMLSALASSVTVGNTCPDGLPLSPIDITHT